MVCTTSGNGLRVMLNSDGLGSFGAPASYTIGSSPKSVALADFNLDGHLDVVTANSGSDDVSVLLNNGDGTLGTAAGYGVGSTPYQVVAADFNADGYPDLAACKYNGASVSVILNNQVQNDGTGTFSASNAGGIFSQPYSTQLIDVDLDGDLDTVLACSGLPGGSSQICVHKNKACP